MPRKIRKRGEDEEKIEWKDIKPFMILFDITYQLMYKKFYPYFYHYQDDVKQEMMYALIKAIRRIKRGEIRSIRNYVITVLKYATYVIGRKIIDYENFFVYLEDLKHMEMTDRPSDWDKLIPASGANIRAVFQVFSTDEEQWMLKSILKEPGWGKRRVRELLKCSWERFDQKEKEVKEKLIEVIKIYGGA